MFGQRFSGAAGVLPARAAALAVASCLALWCAGRAAPEKTAAERASALEDQARLWQEADRMRRDGKQDDCFNALAKAGALEKESFAAPTHSGYYLTEQLAHDRCKDAAKYGLAHGRSTTTKNAKGVPPEVGGRCPAPLSPVLRGEGWG